MITSIELVDPTAEPKMYKMVLPNLVKTATGDEIDIGQIEHYTLQGLKQDKINLEDLLSAVKEKIAAIEDLED